MILYYILVLLFIIIGFIIKRNFVIDKIDSEKRRKVYVIIVFSIMFFLSAFKSVDVGTDTAHYYSIYNWLQTSGRFGIYEPGFALFSLGIGKIFGNFQYLVIFSSAIMISCFAIYIYYEAEDVILSSLLFFFLYFITFNTMMRQGIAISLIALGLILYRRKHKLCFYILCALATSFHYSAVIALLFPILMKVRFKLNYFFATIIVAFAIVKFDFLEVVLSVLNIETIYTKDQGAGGLDALAQTVIALATLVSVWVCNIYTNHCNGVYTNHNCRISRKCNNRLSLWNYAGWSIWLFVFFYILTISMPVMDRFSQYFALGFLTFLPNKLSECRNGRVKFILMMIIISAYILYQTIVFVYRPQWGEVFPYKFFWS